MYSLINSIYNYVDEYGGKEIMTKVESFHRSISKVWDVVPVQGRGSHLQVAQVLAPGNYLEFDPFLMMAEDWFQQGTFDFHPHRGIETVTYIIDGKLKHEDNHGGRGVLEPGDVQIMTAGSGIIHSEDPLAGETVHSLQLWVNLPTKLKMTEPRYQDLRSLDMGVRKVDGGTIRVFSGSSGDVKANTLNHVPFTFIEIELIEGSVTTHDLPSSYNGFIYVLEGNGYFGQEETPGQANQVLWLGASGGTRDSEIVIRAVTPLKALLIAGEPVREQVVARGPFVMNSEEEIKQAFEDYRTGKFSR